MKTDDPHAEQNHPDYDLARYVAKPQLDTRPYDAGRAEFDRTSVKPGGRCEHLHYRIVDGQPTCNYCGERLHL